MPKSKIQAEFLKAAKIDADDYKKRQEYLKAVMDKVNTFKDPQWAKLSEDAQEWMNAAIKAFKGKKPLPDFPDVGSVPKDEDEDEAPAKKKKKAAAVEEDDDEEEEAPKKKKKPAKAEEEDEDEEDEDDEEESEDEDEDEESEGDEEEEDEDEEEDEKPAKKKKKPTKAEEEDEEDEEDEKPAKKKKAKPADDDDEDEKPAKKKKAEPLKSSGVKASIKDAILDDPEISVDALVKKLSKGGGKVSKVTVSNIRAEFRHSLKHLQAAGKLKGVSI